MGKIFEDGHAILTYEESLSEIYWAQLSEYLRESTQIRISLTMN